jgi:hypothetical protein
MKQAAAWAYMVRNRPSRAAIRMRPVISRAATLGLGVVYVAVWTLSSLVLKTTPSDLDLYFWPSAETIVSGHPLLIYATHVHDVYPNANGPLGLLPLVPMAALANGLGWAASLTGRATLTGAVVSLVVLLLALQVVRFTTAARGETRWPLAIACPVLLAPALWIAVIDYGHVEQPVELCLLVLAVTCSLRDRNVLTGIALGAAVLTRTIAGFSVIPFLVVPLATRRLRRTAMTMLAAAVAIGAGIAPFVAFDAQAVVHSLLTYRSGLPIGGGSFWIIARHTSWSGFVRSGDVYVGAAVACALVAFTLIRKPAVGTTHAGLTGLLTVASCCFPLFAKTVFPYYLLEPYVFATLFWLARPGTALNWQALVPLLLTIDVFIVKAASSAPFSAWGAVESVVSSAVVGIAVALVTFDLLHSPGNAAAADGLRLDPRPEPVPAVRHAT